MMNHIVQLAAAFAGSMGFALLFNIRDERILVASTSGLISWGIYLYCAITLKIGDFASYIVAAAGLALFSEIMARIVKAPATVFLVTGMIPLLPGGSLYNTLQYAVKSNWFAFTSSGIYTLMLAIAIALGIICTMSIMQVVFVVEGQIKYLTKRKEKGAKANH